MFLSIDIVWNKVQKTSLLSTFQLQSNDRLLSAVVLQALGGLCSLSQQSCQEDRGQERPRSKVQRRSVTSSRLDSEWECRAWPPTYANLPGDTFISPLAGKNLRCLLCIKALTFQIRKLRQLRPEWATDCPKPWKYMFLEREVTFGLLWSSLISNPKENHFSHTLHQVITQPLLEHLWRGRHDFSCPFHSQMCLIVVSPFSIIMRASAFLLHPWTAASKATRTKPGDFCVPGELLPPWIPLLTWLLSLPCLSFQWGLGPAKLYLV